MSPPPVPGRLTAILRDAASGALPAPVALMHLAMESADPVELAAALALPSAPAATPEGARLAALRELARAHPEAWQTVKGVLEAVSHEPDSGAAPADRVRATAAMFDRASVVSPEGSVALYTLGDAERLLSATREIVRWLDGRGLLGPEVRVLDVGCGIGRVAEALAPATAGVLGLDVSAEMVSLARRRCAAFPNVTVTASSGLDLAEVSSRSRDLVLFVDSFPYIVAAGEELARTFVAEAARVLAPGGALAILNYSYRGDAERDRRDLKAAAVATGLTLAVVGEQPFTLWDGAAFLLIKSP